MPVSSNVVILSALPIEYRASREHLSTLREVQYKGTVYEEGVFSANGKRWQVGIAELGVGNASAAAAVERAISYFDPAYILFVGVAGGIKDVQLGDVVAATKVYGFHSGKETDNIFQPRPQVGNSSHVLVQRARAEARKVEWLKRIGLKDRPSVPRVFVGPIAAGEQIIASSRSAAYKFIHSIYGDALAVEMEGHGFLVAAHENYPVEAIVIRGISDLLANKQRSDSQGFQEIAAHHASAFAFEILAKLDADTLDSPRGQFEGQAEKAALQVLDDRGARELTTEVGHHVVQLLSLENKKLLADLTWRSGRANNASDRLALCIQLGVDTRDLGFIENGSPISFCLCLINYLVNTGNCDAIITLTDNRTLKLFGVFSGQLAQLNKSVSIACR